MSKSGNNYDQLLRYIVVGDMGNYLTHNYNI